MNEEAESLYRQLIVHKKNLADLEIKRAKFGIDVPLYVLRQIEDEQAEIKRLEMTIQGIGTRQTCSDTQADSRFADFGSSDQATIEARLERAKLRQMMVDYFDREDLRTLCFDLGIEYEGLPDALDGMVRELIRYCERHGRIFELIRAAEQRRPGVSWREVLSGD